MQNTNKSRQKPGIPYLVLRLAIPALFLVLLINVVRANDVVPLPDVGEADGSLGTCYTFYEIDGAPLGPLAHAAGSRWDRFDFRWNVIEDTQNNFSFGPHDLIVDRDTANGINVVGILGSTAKWAAPGCPVVIAQSQDEARVPGHPPLAARPTDDLWWRPCPPANLNLPWDHADNDWGRFVYQTVLHFKERNVHTWEIWNEPDLGATFWSGTPAEYAQLLKIGYQAVKAADPDATVLFAGLAYWSNPTFYVDVLDALQGLEGAADNNNYFDAMSLHQYSNVYNIGSVARQIQAAMTARVGRHPIWLTETGVPLWDERPTNPGAPYPYAATIDEAAAYVIEGYAEARAAGVEKFFFFRLHDEAMDEAFGLIRNDRTLRPAYVAYQVAARYLHGENQITGPLSGGSARRITFWGTPYGRIDVLWNIAGGETITHTRPAVMPTATLVDHRGFTQTLTASAGAFTVTLAPATANQTPDGSFMIGGPPVLLIQTDTEPPTSSLHALPSPLFTATLTVTWDVTDTHSGYWYEEIERAPAPEGPWTRIAGYGQTNGVTQTVATLPGSGTWHFRARARDNVGNWEPWPDTAEVSTTAILTRTVFLSVTAFLDTNSNGVWDGDETPPTATTRMAWKTASGAVITETLLTVQPGTIIILVPWHITGTVEAGDYVVEAETAGYLRQRLTFTAPAGIAPLNVDALLPGHHQFTLRNGQWHIDRAARQMSGLYLPSVTRNR